MTTRPCSAAFLERGLRWRRVCWPLLAPTAADSNSLQKCNNSPALLRSPKKAVPAFGFTGAWLVRNSLRQTFQEFAACSILQSDWARAFYDQLRKRGKSHHAALRALAFKWVRIIFRCWKTRTP